MLHNLLQHYCCHRYIHSDSTVTHCNTLQHTATQAFRSDLLLPQIATNLLQLYRCYLCTHCDKLQHTATHSNTLQHTATHCNAQQHTATQVFRLSRNLLQHSFTTCAHTAKHCNTLQHTATHCNTLQHRHLDQSHSLLQR